jgi:hypothetical protein
MICVYWSYKGYAGDEYMLDTEKLTARYAPNSRSVGLKRMGFLSQLGFGPGYYNNSGVNRTFVKSVFKTEADRDAALVKLNQYTTFTTVYNDDVAYYDAREEYAKLAKRMQKQNPY